MLLLPCGTVFNSVMALICFDIALMVLTITVKHYPGPVPRTTKPECVFFGTSYLDNDVSFSRVPVKSHNKGSITN